MVLGLSGPLGTSGKGFQTSCGNRSLTALDGGAEFGVRKGREYSWGPLFPEVVEHYRLSYASGKWHLHYSILHCCVIELFAWRLLDVRVRVQDGSSKSRSGWVGLG